MRRFGAMVAAMLVGLSVWAAPVKATFIDGKVEKQNGSAWVALKDGDLLDSSNTVRLAKGALAEFTMGARKFTLSAAGTYLLDSLAKAGASADQKGSGTMEKLTKIVAPPATTQSAAGGVRGDLIGAGVDKTTWAGSDEDAAAAFKEAQDLVGARKFAEAADKYATIVSAGAVGDELDQAHFGQAFALAADGSILRAIKILRAMPATGSLAGPRAILLARLDLDSGSTDEAVSVLNAAIKAGALDDEETTLAKAMLKESGTTK